MRYQGKFEGNAARTLHVVDHEYPKRITRRQRIISRKKKMLMAEIKTIGKRILMALGLLLTYASLLGMVLGMILIVIQPKNIWSFLIWAISIGYAFLVVNCRAFEYIGDRMGSKW